jgi:mannan endo-1,4-beta-mannosidase
MVLSSTLTAVTGLAALAIAAPSPRQADGGFVTTNGNKFELDGEDFTFAGSNAYYFPFSGVSTSQLNWQARTDVSL